MKPTIVKASAFKESLMPEGCFLYENWGVVSAGDEKVSIARARVQPGITTRAHHLKGIQEIYLITQGTGEVHVGNLEAAEVSVGDVVLIPADTSQQITNVGKTDLIFYCICTPAFEENRYLDDETRVG